MPALRPGQKRKSQQLIWPTTWAAKTDKYFSCPQYLHDKEEHGHHQDRGVDMTKSLLISLFFFSEKRKVFATGAFFCF